MEIPANFDFKDKVNFVGLLPYFDCIKSSTIESLVDSGSYIGVF